MSAHSITAVDRIAALKKFGYSEPEASFVCLAALHGGYFLRRQFAQFLGCRDGGALTQLVQKVLALGHGRASTWRQNTHLYHLCARRFYTALGEPDNRNRRSHAWAQVKTKIMALDFVLANRPHSYLATEQEKLDYFTGTLHIDRAALPAKRYRSASSEVTTTRYFVDKFPVSLALAAHPQAGAQVLVTFSFVDEGTVGLSRFETYLAQYRALFEALSTFQLIYVAATDVHFEKARVIFERFRTREASESSNGPGFDIDRLLTYFKLRGLYEMHQFSAFDRSQLIRLRDAREAFSTPETEALYCIWRAGGDDAVRERLVQKRRVPAPIQGVFSAELLSHDYGLFDTISLR